ncbi:MAG: hypothetical protein E5Y29_26225, partial [Mesorhizobium sp.]
LGTESPKRDVAPERPPLSCRTSPPQGGRSEVIYGFANVRRCRKISRRCGQPISPLEGEMSGRTEGGLVGLNAYADFANFHPRNSVTIPNTCPPSSTPPSAGCWRCCRPCRARR